MTPAAPAGRDRTQLGVQATANRQPAQGRRKRSRRPGTPTDTQIAGLRGCPQADLQRARRAGLPQTAKRPSGEQGTGPENQPRPRRPKKQPPRGPAGRRCSTGRTCDNRRAHRREDGPRNGTKPCSSRCRAPGTVHATPDRCASNGVGSGAPAPRPSTRSGTCRKCSKRGPHKRNGCGGCEGRTPSRRPQGTKHGDKGESSEQVAKAHDGKRAGRMHRRSLRRQRTDRTKRPDGRYDTDEADGDPHRQDPTQWRTWGGYTTEQHE